VEGDLPPWSRRRVLGLWLLETLPMGLVTWVVAPWLIPRLRWPAAAVFLALTGLGLVWQGALALWTLRREGVPLRWEAVRRRTWLQAPRDVRTGERRRWRFLWLAVTLPLALLPLLVGNVLTGSWAALRLLRSPAAIDLSPGYAKSLDLASPEFSGQWWLLALVLVAGSLGPLLGEELLFRGVMLPRMSGAFGRKGWIANATLFALSYVHVPLMLPFRWLAALVTVWPARRYRCTWLSVAVRAGECAGLVALALVGILTPSRSPLETPPAFPQIARRPRPADLSGHCRARGPSLPPCVPGDAFAADLRSCDVSALDLRGAAEAAACVSFDDRTAWPPADRLPGGFVPGAVLERNASPGPGRDPGSDPDSFDSYGPAARWAAEFHDGLLHAGHVFVPVDSRTTASPTGPADRVYYRWGASSWIPPFLAGAFALAAQVDPTVTRERFVALARQTGRTRVVRDGGRERLLGPMLDPAALVAALRGGSPRPESP
jgi:hypothetical protein